VPAPENPADRLAPVEAALGLPELSLSELVTGMTFDLMDGGWMLNPKTGRVKMCAEPGVVDDDDDQPDPEALEAAGWLWVEQVGSDERWEDMAEFAEALPDRAFGGRLREAISGRGAFRRFRELLEGAADEALVPQWYAFRDRRDLRRAVSWLRFAGVIDDATHDRARAVLDGLT